MRSPHHRCGAVFPVARAANFVRCIRALAVAAVSSTYVAVAADFFVSPTGDDANAGTQAAPFKTFSRAQQAWRAARAQAGSATVPVNVWFAAGIYRFQHSLTLNGVDSGTPDFPLTLAAIPGDRVEFSGATPLPTAAFVPVTDSAILERVIDPAARSHLLQCDLKAAGIADYGTITPLPTGLEYAPAPVQLYVNGVRMHLARWPKPGDAYPQYLNQKARRGVVGRASIVDPGPKRGDSDFTTRGGTFTVGFDRLSHWTTADDIWLAGVFGNTWEWCYVHVAALDPVRQSITLASGTESGIIDNWAHDNFFYAENLLEELGEPGEYYLDRKSGMLYLYPPADWSANATVELAILSEQMFILYAPVANVTFRDFIFERGRSQAIVSGTLAQGDSPDLTGIRIERCEFRDFARAAISLTGTNTVSECHLHDLGDSPVTFRGGNLTTLTGGGSTLENSHVHDWPWYQSGENNDGIELQGVGHRVVGNHIHHSSTNATIDFGSGNNHDVEYNDIHDANTLLIDSGVIYGGQGATPLQRGHQIRRNYLHDIGRTFYEQNPVYADQMTMGWTVEQNVFARIGNPADDDGRASTAIMVNSGAYILARNNAFIDCVVPYFLSTNAGTYNYPDFAQSWPAQFAAIPNLAQSAWGQQYPELLNFFNEPRQFPTSNVWDKNVVWNPNVAAAAATVSTLRQGAHDATTSKLQVGTNEVSTTDPGFVDASANNFTLTATASVLGQLPGFTAIPFADIGLRTGVGPFGAQDTGYSKPKPGRLINISARAIAGTGDQSLIVGFNVSGSARKQLLVRASGPALAGFGVVGTVADPTLTLNPSGQPAIASNDDWGADVNGVAIGLTAHWLQAFAFPAGSKDSAMMPTVSAGSYTALMTDRAGGSGVGLVEIYDPATFDLSPVVNLSARGFAGIDAATFIAGFVVGGDTPLRVLLRGVGPTLAGFGVGGTIPHPKLALFHSGATTSFLDNSGWTTTSDGGAAVATAGGQVGAFPLAAGSNDAAMIVSLSPGAYTAEVQSVDGNTGIVLVELYALP